MTSQPKAPSDEELARDFLSPEGPDLTITSLVALLGQVRAEAEEKRDALGKRLCALIPAIMDALESDSDLDARRAAFESVQDFFDDPEAQKWHPTTSAPRPPRRRRDDE